MKRTLPVFLFVVLVAVFGFQVRSADAYSSTSNCVGCHTIFTGGSGSAGHVGHLGLGLPQSCNTCHVSVGDTPATATCGTCHVAPGLPLHHVNASVGVNCVSCHPGTPAPENTAVPGYAGITAALDPCDGSEERFASLTTSLDNDGDLLYDGADPDCQGADTTPPTVASTVPDNNAVNVVFNTLVTATFSEAIDNTTVNGTSFFLNDGVSNVAGTVTVSSDNTMATFTSSALLAASTVYTATLTTAVTDLAGNPLAADYTWSFTTGAGADTTPPTVLSTVPDNNATGVAVTTNISATFSEPIDPASVDGFVTDGVDNVVGTLSVAGSTATFDPTAALADNTVYTATLTTAVTDLAGNPLAADYTWSFTTRVTPPPSTSSSSGCSVIGAGSNWGGGVILFLTLMAILVALRRQGARARR